MKENTLRLTHLAQICTTRSFLVVSLFCLSVGSVQAADEDHDNSVALKSVKFSDLDRNHDGVIDMQEAQAVPDLATIFKSADINKDGVLSEKEFQAAIHAEN